MSERGAAAGTPPPEAAGPPRPEAAGPPRLEAEGPPRLEAATGPPRLEAAGLAKSFGGVVALDGVDVVVGPGEVVALLGPNGAGKTTLFQCLAGVERPDRGRVWLDGRDVTRLPVHQRARLGLARTFQRVELFDDLDVRQHLAVAARSRSRRGRMLAWKGAGRDQAAAEADRVEEILARLGLDGAAGLAAGSLGLGQARLVELGRALATEPTVVLADEPSSGLDDRERLTLARAVPAVTERGAAVVLIEHDIDLVRQVASRVYVLDAGRVVAAGPTEAVLGDAGVNAAWGRPRGSGGGP